MLKDPKQFYEVAKKMGHDPYQLAETYMGQELQKKLMTPEQRELEEYKAKVKKIEDMERQQLERQEQQRKAILTQHYLKEYNEQFPKALQEAGLPANKHTVAQMAKYISRAASMKNKDGSPGGYKLSPKETALMVLEDYRELHGSILKDADGDVLMAILGEDTANKIRKWDTGRLSNPEAKLHTPTQPSEHKPRERGQRKPLSHKEWRELNRKK